MNLMTKVATGCHHWLAHNLSFYLVLFVNKSVHLMTKGATGYPWLGHTLSSNLVCLVSNSVKLKFRVAIGCHQWLAYTNSSYLVWVESKYVNLMTGGHHRLFYMVTTTSSSTGLGRSHPYHLSM